MPARPRPTLRSRTASVRRVTVCLVAAAAVLLPAAASIAAPHRATQPKPVAPTTLCVDNAHLPVAGGLVIRTPFWRGTGAMCVRNDGGGANMQITRVPAPDRRGRVVGFPALMNGCFWNVCSSGTTLPEQLGSLHTLRSTWLTRQRTTSTSDTAYDIWLGTHAQTRGHADAAEVMVWLNHRGGCCFVPKGSPVITVGGRRYLLIHWRAYDSEYHVSWNYIQFRMLSQVQRVKDLNLLTLLRVARRHGLLSSRWYVENVQAGFEIWRGGVRCPDGRSRPNCGLATTHLSITVR